MNELNSSLGIAQDSATALSSRPLVEGRAETSRPVENVAKAADDKKASDTGQKVDAELLSNVKANLTKLNDVIPVTSTNLSFEFDEQGDPPFIRVVDIESKEVIREIPTEEFRELAKALETFADKVSGKGMLFDQTA
ncbi:flagellar protein FlaG [Pseudoalteromonas viridis]|uniref:Flagellar protein FlaG n=1 Tax=Pseudoalteromonas viridis TaxID=339617 RepID=A0ABX7V007_9GAMM|nr:flagellar protein FlaG [Pseudoalteromonas viridis]QTL34214.1 flagellar protein FlaG [Pseudoalteromonas viridis]